MPLTMAKTGEVNVIKRVGGREETRRFLENLGFVAGGNVMVISEIGGNMIVNVKESRVAINKDGFLTLVNGIIWPRPQNCGFFYVKFIKI